MAGDWIKMRVWIARDPRVIAIADRLAVDRRVISWLTDPVQQNCRESAYEHVTRDVMVRVTVSALLQLWGVANDVGHAYGDDGSDLVLEHATIDALDEIAGVPSFGHALALAGWAKELPGVGVIFPKFLRNNIPAEDRQRSQAAARSRAYRARKKDSSTGERHVTDASRVTSLRHDREEKRREEKKKDPERNTRAPRAPLDLAALRWPPALDAPVAREALENWLAYKRERGSAYKSLRGPQEILHEFASRGPDAFAAAVSHSIARNYQGVYAPSGGGGGRGRGERGLSAADLLDISHAIDLENR